MLRICPILSKAMTRLRRQHCHYCTWPIAQPLILFFRLLFNIDNFQVPHRLNDEIVKTLVCFFIVQSELMKALSKACSDPSICYAVPGCCACCCALSTKVFENNSYRIEQVWPAHGFYAVHLPVPSHFRNWVEPSKSAFGLSPHPNCQETSALVIIFCLQERSWNAGRLSLRSWTKVYFVQLSLAF